LAEVRVKRARAAKSPGSQVRSFLSLEFQLQVQGTLEYGRLTRNR
jgi:hypothetical protein